MSEEQKATTPTRKHAPKTAAKEPAKVAGGRKRMSREDLVALGLDPVPYGYKAKG